MYHTFFLGLDQETEIASTPSKKSVLSSTDMLSPTALETKLIASYDAGSDGSLLPTLSPLSQTSRLGYASPSRDGGAFSRSLLSPPRSAGKAAFGGNGGTGRAWSSPSSSSPHRPPTSGGHAGGSDSPGAAGLSHSPLSPLPLGAGAGEGLGMLHLRERVWASPAKGGSSGGGGGSGGGGRDKSGVQCDARQALQEGAGGGGGGVSTLSKSPRSRDWKTAVGDSEQRFFAAAADARDATTAVTPGEVREMARRSGRADGERRLSSSPGDPFESWGRERAGSWGGGGYDGSRRTATSNDRQRQSSPHGEESSWRCDNEREGRSAAASFTPSGGGEDDDHDNASKHLETPRAPSRTAPSPEGSRGGITDAGDDADDTLLAAASLVSFHKPRAAEAPRLKGPLGTSALRVTLGTPVVSAGASSISSSVQAKLSLPRTTPTPTHTFSSLPAELWSSGDGDGAQTAVDPMETAYRAAGLALGSSGGAGSGRSQGGGGAGAKAAKSAASLRKSARNGNGMFDAVSPTAVTSVEESGTPYSVCRVDRNGRPNGTPADASAEQKKDHGSGDTEVEAPKRDAACGESKAAPPPPGGTHGGVEPLCHTPLKPAAAGRESGAAAAAAASGTAARPAGWSGAGAGPWATPPPMAMAIGTPCSGSRFRSADDEESDYSDYETVRAVGRYLRAPKTAALLL